MSDRLCVGSLGGLLADVLTVLEGEPDPITRLEVVPTGLEL